MADTGTYLALGAAPRAPSIYAASGLLLAALLGRRLLRRRRARWAVLAGAGETN